MLKEHFESAGASIDYGDAAGLFPVENLDTTVLQHRNAELTLDDAVGNDVIVVAPTNLATSYFLTRHTLTVIPIDSLPAALRTQLDDEIAAPLYSFTLIQIGKWVTDSPNRSLAEYTNA